MSESKQMFCKRSCGIESVAPLHDRDRLCGAIFSTAARGHCFRYSARSISVFTVRVSPIADSVLPSCVKEESTYRVH